MPQIIQAQAQGSMVASVDGVATMPGQLFAQMDGNSAHGEHKVIWKADYDRSSSHLCCDLCPALCRPRSSPRSTRSNFTTEHLGAGRSPRRPQSLSWPPTRGKQTVSRPLSQATDLNSRRALLQQTKEDLGSLIAGNGLAEVTRDELATEEAPLGLMLSH